MVTAARPAERKSPRTLERAFAVLDSFSVEAWQWRTSELAEHCDLPVPTVHRILGVLERFGYVRRDPDTRAYHLGSAAAGFVRSASDPLELRRIALPGLRSLWAATGEEVLLSALDESRRRGIRVAGLGSDADSANGGAPTLGRDAHARYQPLHAGASFKLLLAQLPAEEVNELVGRGLERITSRTITDPDRLRADLAAIRRRGWAFSREEADLGRWAVSVPVRLPSSGTLALAISTPVARLSLARARESLALLGLAAQQLTRRFDRDRSATLMAAVRNPGPAA